MTSCSCRSVDKACWCLAREILMLDTNWSTGKSLCNLELMKDHSITVAERRNDYQVDQETQQQSSQRLRGWSSKQLVRIGRWRLSWEQLNMRRETHTEGVRVTSVSGGRCSRWWGALARDCCLMKPNSLDTVMCCCYCRWSLRGKRNSFFQKWPPCLPACLPASHRFCSISTVALSVPNICTWVEYWSLIISTN